MPGTGCATVARAISRTHPHAPPASVPTSCARAFRYILRIRAHNVPGWSPWSDWKARTTDNARVPNAPIRPISQPVFWINPATSNRIAWKAPSHFGLAITNYQLEVGLEAPPSLFPLTHTPSLLQINNGSWIDLGVVTSFVHRSLTPSTEYFYRLRCSNLVGYSEPSPVLNVTTAVGSSPGKPTNVRAGGTLCCGLSNITSLTIAWTAPPSDLPIKYYTIEYRYAGSTSNDPPGRQVVSNPLYTLTELEAGATLNITIEARSDAGFSPLSNVAVFKLQPPRSPEAPDMPFQVTRHAAPHCACTFMPSARTPSYTHVTRCIHARVLPLCTGRTDGWHLGGHPSLDCVAHPRLDRSPTTQLRGPARRLQFGHH